jgi:hypothetical protein
MTTCYSTKFGVYNNDVPLDGDIVIADAPSAQHNYINGEWKLNIEELNTIITDYLNSIRVMREVLLNRLAGIGLAALMKNDTATVQAISYCRTSLLNITKLEAVLTATDLNDLKIVIEAAYADIISASPANIKKIYQGINF